MGRRNYLVEGVSGTGKTSVGDELLHASGSDTPNGIAIDATAPLSRVVDQILGLTASERMTW